MEPPRRAIDFVKGEDGDELAELPGPKHVIRLLALQPSETPESQHPYRHAAMPWQLPKSSSPPLYPSHAVTLEPRRPLAKWSRRTDDEVCHSPQQHLSTGGFFHDDGNRIDLLNARITGVENVGDLIL